MTDPKIKQRLQAWAEAYGGDQFRRLGYASTQTLADGSAAVQDVPDEIAHIEQIVAAMEQQGRWKEGRVLRAEYLLASLPEAERLRGLMRVGLAMSRTAYYVYLGAAHAYVDGAMLGGGLGACSSQTAAAQNETKE